MPVESYRISSRRMGKIGRDSEFIISHRPDETERYEIASIMKDLFLHSWRADFDDKPLGSGGFGTVTAAFLSGEGLGKHPLVLSNQRCAIKEMKLDLEELIREVTIPVRAAALWRAKGFPGPPPFPRVYAWGVTDDRDDSMFVASELLATDMRRLAKRRPFTEMEARDVASKLLMAATVLFELDVRQCDLKPENLMVRNKRARSEPVLIDFGGVYDRNGGSGHFAYTGRPPECLADHSASCGCTDAFMLAMIPLVVVHLMIPDAARGVPLGCAGEPDRWCDSGRDARNDSARRPIAGMDPAYPLSRCVTCTRKASDALIKFLDRFWEPRNPEQRTVAAMADSAWLGPGKELDPAVRWVGSGFPPEISGGVVLRDGTVLMKCGLVGRMVDADRMMLRRGTDIAEVEYRKAGV